MWIKIASLVILFILRIRFPKDKSIGPYYFQWFTVSFLCAWRKSKMRMQNLIKSPKYPNILLRSSGNEFLEIPDLLKIEFENGPLKMEFWCSVRKQTQ